MRTPAPPLPWAVEFAITVAAFLFVGWIVKAIARWLMPEWF